ncbi:MAG: acetyltransferase [Bryobacteraceae bacterium]
MATGQDASRITLRPLETLPEFREALTLQKEIWGFEDIELLPLRLFVVARKVGGQVIGAFDESAAGGPMIGFLLAIPGLKKDRAYLHSHMMGVQPRYRNLGVGRRLKLAQRDDALQRGIGLVEWTFDPLEIKNAYFNIERLGARVRRFVLNQYGATSSPLHGGLPTDRCVAEWDLASERVCGVAAGGPAPHGEVAARVGVPNDIAAIRSTDYARARTIQQGVSNGFIENFSRGLTVTGLERTPDAAVYLFAKCPSE